MRVRFIVASVLSVAVAACVFGSEDKPSGAVVNATAAPAVDGCIAGDRPSSGFGLAPALGDTQFSQPIGVHPSPKDSGVFYVVERKGVVKRFGADGNVGTVLELGERVTASAGEGGLLGFALHPKFADNGTVFLSFTKPWPAAPAGQRSVIARAQSTDGGLTIAPASVVEILSLPDDPYSNHNGGNIVFGPDGFLYASFGDGGSGGDPLHNGQNTNVLFGKILRIDVDAHGDATPGYGIPADNPFRNGGGLPEIFSYGMRNTWRFSFDRLKGDLWAGDVGQNKYEEVDKIVLGGNYGWGTREGMHCYGGDSCDVPGAIEPIVEYDHAQGSSITGGFVYRGKAIPSLVGQYLYGDYGSGRIWSIPTDKPNPTAKLLASSGLSISTFGQDNDGELYVADYSSGKIKKIVGGSSSDGLPSKLTETGCFAATDARVPTSRLVPYDVVSPLWSDGADKKRWLALPPGGKIRIQPDGDFDLPIGSVLVKEFSVGGKRVETRLFMRHTDGGWAGYTYEWNDAESEGDLLAEAKSKPVNATASWSYPSRAQCMSCHNGAVGGSIGLEIGQLDRDFAYPDGTTQNQLAKLTALGAFDATTALPATHRAFPDPASTSESLEARSRAYLHANCSFCHRPEGPGRGIADLRFDRTFAQTKLCNGQPEAGDLGVYGAKLIVPAHPESSLLSLRIHATVEGKMPPLARAVVDPLGTSIVDGWITSVTSCP